MPIVYYYDSKIREFSSAKHVHTSACMSETKIPNRPPLLVWQVESLRMTAFPSPAAQVATEPTWWTDLLGEPAEKQVVQPKQKARREEGAYEGGKLILTTQPARIDWVYVAVDDPEGGQGEPPTIGAFPATVDLFSRLMLRWFERGACPSVHRLAFGAVLSQLIGDQQTGYQRMTSYFPNLSLNLEGASDFAYQINRPRSSTSGVVGLRINRLSKWAVPIWTMVEFPVTPEAGLQVRQGGAACRLELDINTAPDFPGDLPHEYLSRIFKELVNLGQEIAEKGDIP